jgi:DNA repair exonuclease SbcCD ATPase subunit
VENQSGKWDAAVAVRIGDFSKSFASSPKGKKIIEQISALEGTIESFDGNLLKKLAAQKSQYKACTNCGSKISIKHYVKNKETDCPVCKGSFIKTEKDKLLFKKLRDQLSLKQKEMYTLKKTFEEKSKTEKPCWYVGGWASC